MRAATSLLCGTALLLGLAGVPPAMSAPVAFLADPSPACAGGTTSVRGRVTRLEQDLQLALLNALFAGASGLPNRLSRAVAAADQRGLATFVGVSDEQTARRVPSRKNLTVLVRHGDEDPPPRKDVFLAIDLYVARVPNSNRAVALSLAWRLLPLGERPPRELKTETDEQDGLMMFC